ncbi:MAG: nucleotidyltransferase domain-containing protein [Archaeoglobaceae archaeon]|nr:nucleotidyltransferase domain-containing protein [Archaeoglobaceae archaeon]MDW8118022.1 nucleotidyltransferase domain-containing protein [Archaeoglobaceae archaeon]
MGLIKNAYERRKKYFENLESYLLEIRRIVKEEVAEAELFLFGSVVEGDYSIGLSDIDVAIVSDAFLNRDLKLKILGILFEKFFDSPFEFHVLTKERWEYYKRFIKKFRSF